MFKLASGMRKLACFLLLACLAGRAQNVPDAPLPKVTPQPEAFPADSAPAPRNAHDAPADPSSNGAAATPTPAPTESPRITPAGPGEPGSDFTLFHSTNFVQIPVTVKDKSGR